MPDDVNGSELMMERLSKDNYLDILDSLGYQNTEVLLPQLAAFTNGLDLEPFFKKLGVKAAFNQTVSGSTDNNNKTSSTSRDHASKSPVVTLVSMKQNAYFSMSFITINSVGSVGTKLGGYQVSYVKWISSGVLYAVDGVDGNQCLPPRDPIN